MIHKILPVGPLQCNCSIFGDENTHEALVIDPGDDSVVESRPVSPRGMIAAVAGAVVLIGLVSLLWSKRPRPRRRDVELAQQRAVFGDATGRLELPTI